ncbi:MAG TPA: hypothetical protein VNZ52_14870 [Candidatus Thermoplasmatota archaeon]|nr:hypothetical protein [Candidatus Thermoplasmatota archaeon]
MGLPTPADVDGARGYTELFRHVKHLVERRIGKSRAGIMLGLTSLGVSPGGFLGGYFVLGSNAIVLNRDVLDYIKATQPDYHNAYAFHVLLHEYLHTLGYIGEDEVRPLAHALSVEALGEDHAATRIAAALNGAGEQGEVPEFFRKLVYPEFGWRPQGRPHIEIIKGFDPDATPYIG